MVCHTGTGIPLSLPALFMMPARRFPDLQLVLAHCGGPLLALEAMVAAAFCPSATPGGHGIGKIVGLDVSAATRAAILWDTAQRLFGGSALQ